jgi:hypothetical protein
MLVVVTKTTRKEKKNMKLRKMKGSLPPAKKAWKILVKSKELQSQGEYVRSQVL